MDCAKGRRTWHSRSAARSCASRSSRPSRCCSPKGTQQLRVTAIDAAGPPLRHDRSGVRIECRTIAGVDGRGFVQARRDPRRSGDPGSLPRARHRLPHHDPAARREIRPAAGSTTSSTSWSGTSCSGSASSRATCATTRRSCGGSISTSSARCRPPPKPARFSPITSPNKRAQARRQTARPARVRRLLDDAVQRPAAGRSIEDHAARRGRHDALAAPAVRGESARTTPWSARSVTAKGNVKAEGPAAFYKALDTPELTARSISQVFLGVRIECAQCHHHPVRSLGPGRLLRPGRLLHRRSSRKGRLPSGGEGDRSASPPTDLKHPRTAARLIARPQDALGEGPEPKPVRTFGPPFRRGRSARRSRRLDDRARTIRTSPRRSPTACGPITSAAAWSSRSTTAADEPGHERAAARRSWPSTCATCKYDLKAFTRTLLNSRLYQLSSDDDRRATQPTSRTSRTPPQGDCPPRCCSTRSARRPARPRNSTAGRRATGRFRSGTTAAVVLLPHLRPAGAGHACASASGATSRASRRRCT